MKEATLLSVDRYAIVSYDGRKFRVFESGHTEVLTFFGYINGKDSSANGHILKEAQEFGMKQLATTAEVK